MPVTEAIDLILQVAAFGPPQIEQMADPYGVAIDKVDHFLTSWSQARTTANPDLASRQPDVLGMALAAAAAAGLANGLLDHDDACDFVSMAVVQGKSEDDLGDLVHCFTIVTTADSRYMDAVSGENPFGHAVTRLSALVLARLFGVRCPLPGAEESLAAAVAGCPPPRVVVARVSGGAPSAGELPGDHPRGWA